MRTDSGDLFPFVVIASVIVLINFIWLMVKVVPKLVAWLRGIAVGGIKMPDIWAIITFVVTTSILLYLMARYYSWKPA